MSDRVVNFNSIVSVRNEGDTVKLGGVAAPFNDEIKFQGQRELITPTAFDNVLEKGDDVKLITDHSIKVENLLASRKSGSLQLTKTDKGLEFEASLPSPLIDKTRHIVSLAERGELGASVAWHKQQYQMVNNVRQFTDLQIYEISLTAIPAYKNTTVEQRQEDNDVWMAIFKTRQEASQRQLYCPRN